MDRADARELVADLPAPWDELTVTQAVYLRHRLALVSSGAIADHYGVTEGAVRTALWRACKMLLVDRENDLLVLAAREGVKPLRLHDV